MNTSLWRCAALWIAACLCAAPALAQTSFNAATYNLRYNTPADGPDAWPARREAVKALLRYHEVDLLATQEGLIDQIEDLATMPGFAWVGVGRDDGRRAGEHSAIFYRTARFELLAQGTFWLSETPDTPGMGWDARCCKRIASWARLRERASGRVLLVMSAHFDHEGTVARRESAHLVVRRLQALAGEEPALLMGDLNSRPVDEPYRIITRTLRDARAVSQTPPYGPEGTFNGFKLDAALVDRIDYIFVTPAWRVLRYAALTDTSQGRFPSDHLPVVVRLLLE